MVLQLFSLNNVYASLNPTSPPLILPDSVTASRDRVKQQPPGSVGHTATENSSAQQRHFYFNSSISAIGSERGILGRLMSRFPPPTPHGVGVIDYSYSPSDGDHTGHTLASPSDPRNFSPPTASGSQKEVSTVVIACRQCRSRKIRCDSTRPGCLNCARRSNNCEYDVAPKRRGPDKRPGTRQRSCKKRPADEAAPPSKRKRTSAPQNSFDASSSTAKKEMTEILPSPPSTSRSTLQTLDVRPPSPVAQPASPPISLRVSTADLSFTKDSPPATSLDTPLYPYHQAYYPSQSSYPRQVELDVPPTPERFHHPKFPPPPPSMLEQLKKWWENFLDHYTIGEIADELTYLFSDDGHWFSFLNLQTLLDSLWDVEERLNIQPSFLLASLAMATLMKSEQPQYGPKARARAVWLRDSAQIALDAALRSEWSRDATLAETALLLVLYESSAHPQYNPERVVDALIVLDNIIRNLDLLTNDSSDLKVSNFPHAHVPTVYISDLEDALDKTCSCIPSTSANPPDPSMSWTYPLVWDLNWSSMEIRDEECRRVGWNALGLVANYTVQCAAFGRAPPLFHLSDPHNFALLFPGEASDRVSPVFQSADCPSAKESIWALYCRSMLLWSFCDRLRYDPSFSEEDKYELAQEAWSETQAIQDSLDVHICNLDTTILYMTREYIFNARMAITHALRSLQGLETTGFAFNRRQAEEWIHYQKQVIKRVELRTQQSTSPQSLQLTGHPFNLTWFTNQLSICLILWTQDRSLVSALILAKSLLGPVDAISSIGPSDHQQRQTMELRSRLTESCKSVGLEPPFLPPYTQPSLLRSN